jgi:hypothetical protein
MYLCGSIRQTAGELDLSVVLGKALVDPAEVKVREPRPLRGLELPAWVGRSAELPVILERFPIAARQDQGMCPLEPSVEKIGLSGEELSEVLDSFFESTFQAQSLSGLEIG